jgi:hypothetical protein
MKMPVEVGELVNNVQVMDGDSIFTPQMLSKISQLFLKQIEDHENHQKRVRAEQRVTGGVSQELMEDLA